MAKSTNLGFLLLLSQMHSTLAASSNEKHIYPPLSAQMQCYSLPYGGIGFASHLITYYVVVMLTSQRSPWTWRKLNHKVFGQIISAISIVVTFSIGVASIHRCDFDSSVAAVGIWEIILSVAFGCLSYHAACWIGRSTDVTDAEPATSCTLDVEKGFMSRTATQETPSQDTTSQDTTSQDTASQSTISQDETNQETPPAYTPSPETPLQSTEGETKAQTKNSPRDVLTWPALYSIGASITIAGLISLVVREIGQRQSIERITLIFGTLSATIYISWLLILLLVSLGDIKQGKETGWSLFGMFVFGLVFLMMTIIGVVGPLYGDWIMGALAGDFGGVPSSGNRTLHWVFFAAKILPFLSF